MRTAINFLNGSTAAITRAGLGAFLNPPLRVLELKLNLHLPIEGATGQPLVPGTLVVEAHLVPAFHAFYHPLEVVVPVELVDLPMITTRTLAIQEVRSHLPSTY